MATNKRPSSNDHCETDPNGCRPQKTSGNTLFYVDNDCELLVAESTADCPELGYSPSINDGREHVLVTNQSTSQSGIVRSKDTVRSTVAVEHPIVSTDDGCGIGVDLDHLDSLFTTQDEVDQSISESVAAQPWPLEKKLDGTFVPVEGVPAEDSPTFADHPSMSPIVIKETATPWPLKELLDGTFVPVKAILTETPSETFEQNKGYSPVTCFEPEPEFLVPWPVECDGTPVAELEDCPDGPLPSGYYQDRKGPPIIHKPCAQSGGPFALSQDFSSDTVTSFPAKTEPISFNIENDSCCCELVVQLNYSYTFEIKSLGEATNFVFKGYGGCLGEQPKCWTLGQENIGPTEGELRRYSACDVATIPPKTIKQVQLWPEIQVSNGATAPVTFDLALGAEACYTASSNCC